MNDDLKRAGADPASLDPMANQDDPSYMPTIDVIRIVRRHRELDYILRLATRGGYNQFAGMETTGVIDADLTEEIALVDAIAIEIACREILDANRWMLVEGA